LVGAMKGLPVKRNQAELYALQMMSDIIKASERKIWLDEFFAATWSWTIPSRA